MDSRLSLEEFEAERDVYDHSASSEPGVDRFCSRSEWILPFHRAFLPERELHLYRRGRTFVALAARRHPQIGLYLEPLETMWRFACPVIGPGAADLLAELHTAVAEREHSRGVPMILSGIPVSGDLQQQLLSKLEHHRIRAIDRTSRFIASLEGGIDAYLGRRSTSLRRNLRAASRRAEQAGVRFQRIEVSDTGAATHLYERILSIERRSWKSQTSQGVDSGPMCDFYRDMLPRLAARGRLRVIVAGTDDRDVGYLHGGLVADHFRGLQMSYDRSFANLSLGNLLQREMIGALCEEGVRTYDLGGQSEYKTRWAEQEQTTLTFACSLR